MFKKLVLIFWGLMLGSTITHAQDQIALAWIRNDAELWVFNGDTAQIIATDTIQGAALSPDHAHIAYNTDAGLNIVNTQTGTIVTQLTAELNQHFSRPVWVDNQVVVFNTFLLSEGPPGRENLYDIQRLTLDGTHTEMRPPGQGGELTISSDHRLLAIARPGEYGEADKPGVVQLLDAQTAVPVNEAFSFEAVATGSEFRWVPQITWYQDTIAFAIPHPDLLYSQQDQPPTRVCQVSVDDTSCIELVMSYPVAPVWNDNLSQIAFVRGDATQRQIVFGPLDNLQSLPSTERWPEPVIWLDDNSLLYREVMGGAPGYFIATEDDIQPWRPVIAIQPLEGGRFALASGDFSQATIEIYAKGEFTSIITHEESFVRFATR